MQKGSLNKVLLIGHLGQEPEVKFAKSGVAITRFSLATNESWKDKDGNIQDKTEWHKIVMFGKMAETAGEFLKKGNLVYLEGRLKTDSWESDGVKRYSTDVVVDNWTTLGKKTEGDKQEEDDSLPF